MPVIGQPGGLAIAAYIALGAVMGLVGVVVTRTVFAIEDAFEHLALHWMWWPILGGMVVGLVGLVEPATLGVGYDNIEQILQGLLSWRGLVDCAWQRNVGGNARPALHRGRCHRGHGRAPSRHVLS
jgi:H+/Cl- antiporter ClcA